jgi:phosphate transport system substrate-binding protein
MIKYVGVIAGILCLTFAIDTPAQDTGKIVLRGATTTEALITPWVKSFAAENPGIQVDINGSRQQEGFRALLMGNADILMSARVLKEAEKQQAEKLGIHLAEVWLANEGVAIVTNPSNTTDELTIEQLAKLWSGEFNTWDQVGGPKMDVSLIVGPPDSAMRQVLEADVLKCAAGASATEIKSASNMHMLTPTREGALTYCRTELALDGERRNKLKILAIKRNADSPAIKPGRENAETRSYAIVRPLTLVYNSLGASEPVKKFLEYCSKKSKENTR